MTRVTLLGSSGYVGRHLAQYFKAQGFEVFTPTRDSKKIFEQHLGYVIYANGLTANFRQQPLDTVNAHICYLNTIIRAASFDRLLYLSSTRIYSRMTSSEEYQPVLIETGNADELYNISKLAGEATTLHNGRGRGIVARLSNVVGGESPSDSFIKSLIDEAKRGEIFLRTAFSSEKDYIHINDATIMLARITLEGRQSIYNVGAGVQISNRTWVEALKERFGCVVRVAPGAPENSFPPINIEKFCSEFSVRPGSALRAVFEL